MNGAEGIGRDLNKTDLPKINKGNQPNPSTPSSQTDAVANAAIDAATTIAGSLIPGATIPLNVLKAANKFGLFKQERLEKLIKLGKEPNEIRKVGIAQLAQELLGLKSVRPEQRDLGKM